MSWKAYRFKRGRKMVRHHIRNRTDGGTSTASNLVVLEEKKEKAFHIVFGSLTFYQAVQVLLRLDKMKGCG